ncbi:hypothetical protein MKK75_09190 [Methylobacterium sp. J-030]|uniref:hypothetical protein n=1 Tax=Methylobacterium sp. J-030 TaxID=2836627 RepID=UPI001FB8E299|nr:hypothetical protein [Methylobacterium sp. J-030]MCJ2068974.1 hypothetical protein [Methylobacterium sp. J-030]
MWQFRNIALIALCIATPAAAEYIPLRSISPGVKVQGGSDIPPPKLSVALGQGYDIIKNALRGDCVVQNGHDHSDGRKGAAQFDVEYINTVSDMQSYDKVSQQSATFSFTYKLFSAGLDDDMHTETSFSSVNQFARLYRRIITKIETRNDGAWSDTAQKIANKDLSKAATRTEFMDVCGTHFVSAIYRGDVVDQTIHFTLKKDKYEKDSKLKLSAGLTGLFNAGYSNNDAETKINEVATYIATRNGDQGLIGKNAPDPNKTGGILEAARYIHSTYSDQVAAAEPDQSAIIGVDVQPYWRFALKGRENFGRWQDVAFDSLKARQPTFERLLSAMGDLSFALSITDPAKRAIFYKDVEDTLKAKLILAAKIKKSFESAAATCYRAALGTSEADATAKCGADLTAALPPDEVDSTRPTLVAD